MGCSSSLAQQAEGFFQIGQLPSMRAVVEFLVERLAR
ncbi:hypothetical protein FHT78_003386 [Rhizobium sp. BK196]|nr:hypothetical protein [Rhizobium sp. BK196]MBB3460845.1 hypothetical protein [Rhizobium sp. BK377]